MSDYTITLPNVDEPKTYARVDAATKFADKFALENTVELKVIHAPTGAVIHVATYVPAGVHFHPWQRVETPKHEAPDFENYTPAYTRKRIGATVYRPNEKGLGWLVYDGRSGNSEIVANTKEACKLTVEMGKGKVL